MKPPLPDVDRFALAGWNYRNLRSREEYRHHPRTYGQPDIYYAGCDHCQTAKHDQRKARP